MPLRQPLQEFGVDFSGAVGQYVPDGRCAVERCPVVGACERFDVDAEVRLVQVVGVVEALKRRR